MGGDEWMWICYIFDPKTFKMSFNFDIKYKYCIFFPTSIHIEYYIIAFVLVGTLSYAYFNSLSCEPDLKVIIIIKLNMYTNNLKVHFYLMFLF